MFGGYAAEDWAKHGQFYGNASTFIFSVLPNLARFTAGGANANVQYCGHNFAQLPNGFGFGGQACALHACDDTGCTSNHPHCC